MRIDSFNPMSANYLRFLRYRLPTLTTPESVDTNIESRVCKLLIGGFGFTETLKRHIKQVIKNG